ncbi:MAG: hypothetical protein ACU0BF_06695 [Paracoccaceae bacterium]
MPLNPRVILIALVSLTIVFACLYGYARASRREALEEEWQVTGRVGDRDAHVAAGLTAYEPTLRRRLAIWVFGVPLGALALYVAVSEALA